MSIELTNEQKAEIVRQHLYTLSVARYNVELSIEEINATSFPDEANLENLNDQITDIDSKIDALTLTMASLITF